MIKHLLAAGLLLAPFVTAHAEDEAPEARKPNIIFLFADDLGWGDLSCHGHEQFKTPHIDKLAKQSTSFTQFVVNSGVCSPSRAAVLTGKFPARFNINQHFSNPAHNKKCGMPDWLDAKAVQLPRLLQAAGYKTAHYGKWHLTNTGCDDAPVPSEYGYDDSGVFNGPGPQISAQDDTTYDKTIEFIEKHQAEPFFIHVSMHEPHTPHWPKPKYLEQFKDLDLRHKVYAAVLAEADHGVGRILKALDDNGLAENTLVVFTSDNGPETTSKKKQPVRVTKEGISEYGTFCSVGSSGGLKGRKRSLFEGGVRVPFFVRWPEKTPAGVKNDTTVVTAVDLLPTFCKAAGVALPEDYQGDGEDMLDAFMGKEQARTKTILWDWQGSKNGDNWPRLGIREGEWKLVMTTDGKKKELYNIPKDRAEKTNLAKANPEIAKKLSEAALAWKASLPKKPDAHCISKLRK